MMGDGGGGGVVSYVRWWEEGREGGREIGRGGKNLSKIVVLAVVK
jgi:hypothetical protein